jgi:quinol-cytochrome oxidoreductase complex cytochrome b subunit
MNQPPRRPATSRRRLPRSRRVLITVLGVLCVANIGVLTLAPGQARGVAGIVISAVAILALVTIACAAITTSQPVITAVAGPCDGQTMIRAA